MDDLFVVDFLLLNSCSDNLVASMDHLFLHM